MSFAAEWKSAKTLFETATGKKKPGEKVLGAVKLGTGLEAAAKGLDAALEAGDAAGLQKAAEAFEAAVKKYLVTLRNAATAEKNDAVKAEIAKLETSLDDIVTRFKAARTKVQGAADKAEVAKEAERRKVQQWLVLAKEVHDRIAAQIHVMQKLVTDADKALLAISAAAKTGDKKTADAQTAAVGELLKTGLAEKKKAEGFRDSMVNGWKKVLADVQAYEAKNGKGSVLDRATQDKQTGPLYDAVGLRFEALGEELGKLQERATKAAQARKGALDEAAAFAEAFRAYLKRVREARQALYAQCADITAFADKCWQDIDNARQKPEPARGQELAKVKAEIERRKVHTTEADKFLALQTKLLGALYADQILTDPRVANVAGGPDEVKVARDVLGEIEAMPPQVEKARTKIAGYLRELG